MNNAPIDIIISIIERHRNEAEALRESMEAEEARTIKIARISGRIAAYEDLIEEFEGFKKLFN